MLGGKESEFDGVFEGDDGLFVSDVEIKPDHFKRLGFNVKLEVVSDACAASFCGLIFPDSGQIIRDPVRFFEKFGWTSSFIQAGDNIMMELLKAKSMSALCETPNCPLVSAAAWYTLQQTSAYKPRFIKDGYHDTIDPSTTFNKPVIAQDTRVLFAERFGISVDEQISMESRLYKGDFDIANTLFDSCVDKDAVFDLADYASRYVALG